MRLTAKLIILVAVFLAGFYYGQKQATAPVTTITEQNPVVSNSTAETTPENESISVALAIDNGQDEVKNFDDITVAAGASVFDLLKTVTEQNGIDLQYKDYGGDLGVMVESIGGTSGDLAANRYWQYWLNGEYALVGASTQILKDGDKVEWKYTKGQN